MSWIVASLTMLASPGREAAAEEPGGLVACAPVGLCATRDVQDDPSGEPLVLVHGLGGGSPAEFADLVHGLARGRRIYQLPYDSLHVTTGENGRLLAAELRALASRLGSGHALTIVAHSMGGIVARRALNELTLGAERGIERFRRVHLVAVDTPWHGYAGPSDQGADRALMLVARAFLPAGLMDMRAASTLFAGDPGSADPVKRRPLLDVELPDHVTLDLVFAARGDAVSDYRESFLRPLAGILAQHYRRDVPVRGEPRLMNFWKALTASREYGPFAIEMWDLGDAGRLDEAAVRAALEHHFPVLSGDHDTVLHERSGHNLLDYLAARLDSAPESPRGIVVAVAGHAPAY